MKAVLVLAELVFDFVEGELRFEFEEVVQHLHAAARDVIEQVGVGAVFLVKDVSEREKFLVGFEERFLRALEADAAVAEILLDPEENESPLHDVLVETVVAQRIDEVDEVSELARVDDAEAVDIPADWIAGFGDPPVVIFAEADDAPIES